MRKSHTPTPDQIDRAVCKAFRADIETVRSKSRKADDVVPREVSLFLGYTIGAMEVPEIALSYEVVKKTVYNSIDTVRGRVRVDHDFALRVWEAQRLIIEGLI